MVNLNKEHFYIKEFPCGKTQNIEIKVGRKKYMIDLDKNAGNVTVGMYRKLNSDRAKYSKYDPKAHLHTVTVKTTALLTKRFFLAFEEIAKAQHILEIFASEIQ